jgi:uncharacterized membrane protein
MPNTNNTTNNNFSSNQNVSDKHLSYYNQSGQLVQPTQNQQTNNAQTQQAQSFGNQNAQTNPNQQQINPNLRPLQPAQNPMLNQNNPAQQNPVLNQQTSTQNQQVIRPRVSAPAQPLSIQQPQQPRTVQTPQPVSVQTPRVPVQQPQNPQAQTNSQIRYLNPNNIQQAIPPKTIQDLKQQAVNANQQLPAQPTQIPTQHYDKMLPQTHEVKINTFDVLKLCEYIIPGLSIFLLLFKSIKDEVVMWHARQSLVAQAIWLTAYFIFENINFPLISGSGITLANIWNLAAIGVLIYAGAQAYIGKQYRIPIISDIGTVFIDGR